MCVVDRDLGRHLAALDKEEAKQEYIGGIEDEAEAEFKAAVDAADMNRPMSNTSHPVFHSDAAGHARKLGTRMCTFSEVLYDFMDNVERSDAVLKALVLCAKQGNKEAVDVVEQIKQEYVKTYISEELKNQEGA